MKLFLLLSLAFTFQARAEDAHMNVSFGAPKCFEREYSKEHMKTHPKQRVTSLHLTLMRDQLNELGYGQRWVDVTATIKGYGKEKFGVAMSCDENGRCGIDCDGGTAYLSYQGEQMRFKNEGITVVGGCGGDGNPIEIVLEDTKGGDDVFMTNPVSKCEEPDWFKNMPR